MQRSDGFCRVNQRQNESGVLRGGKSFYCQHQQDAACAFKTQAAIKRQGRLLSGDLAVLYGILLNQAAARDLTAPR